VLAILDTHALLWWFSDDPALGRPARKFISNTANAIVVSAASAWEIATKVRLGKLPSAADRASEFVAYVEREGLELLPISGDHAIRAGLLPGPRKDTFDRRLIAQAQADGMPMVSNDVVLDHYGLRRIRWTLFDAVQKCFRC
jgi:PIN domain nuclease of toxin-antitoxin system